MIDVKKTGDLPMITQVISDRKKKKSVAQPCLTIWDPPWTAACQASLSVADLGFNPSMTGGPVQLLNWKPFKTLCPERQPLGLENSWNEYALHHQTDLSLDLPFCNRQAASDEREIESDSSWCKYLGNLLSHVTWSPEVRQAVGLVRLAT